MDRYAVTGHPIAHSLSPRIHIEFGEQTGRHVEYGLLDLEPDAFDRGVREFFAHDGKGLNVTVPHKERAFRFADQVSMAARVAGAANTLSRTDDGIVGHTTDGAGLLRDLQFNIGFAVAGTRVLVVGAGGTARSILLPLIAAGPGNLTLTNRTHANALALVDNFAGFGPIDVVTLSELAARRFDLIVNATSASLDDALPGLPDACVEDALCYDVMYAKHGTVFTRWAGANGASATCTGIGMLVEQAAESFAIWHGVRPETDTVLARLHADLALT